MSLRKKMSGKILVFISSLITKYHYCFLKAYIGQSLS